MSSTRLETALLVVDVQNDFCAGGALAIPAADDVVAPINRLMDQCPHVILTQDWHPPSHSSFASSHVGRAPGETLQLEYGPQVLWPDHCVQGSWGADFHPHLATGGAQLILRKGFRHELDSYSAFFENDRRTSTGLAGYLRERGFRRLILAGLAFDFCVLWSAEDAIRLGFETIVAEEACRALDIDGSRSEAERRLAASGARRLPAAALETSLAA